MFGFKTLIALGFFSSVLATIQDVSTKGDFEYTYFPMKSNTINFEVKTWKDASIIISETTSPNIDVDPFIEVILGGSNNTESVIRRKRPHKLREKVFTVTPNIVSDSEFRGFWIKFVGDTILVGEKAEKLPMMVWKDPAPFKRNYFGVSSCCGATAEWKVDIESADYDGTPCAPSAIQSMNLPLRYGTKNKRMNLLDGDCFDVLVHQCGIRGDAVHEDIVSRTPTHRGTKRYIIDTELKTWDEAKNTCEKRGQSLGSVKNEEEQHKLEEAIQNSNNPFSRVWIAASDRGHAGQFVWYDGTNDVMTYNNWESTSQSKDTNSKNCVFASYLVLKVKSQAYWYLQECNDTWNFACQVYE